MEYDEWHLRADPQKMSLGSEQSIKVFVQVNSDAIAIMNAGERLEDAEKYTLAAARGLWKDFEKMGYIKFYEGKRTAQILLDQPNQPVQNNSESTHYWDHSILFSENLPFPVETPDQVDLDNNPSNPSYNPDDYEAQQDSQAG